MQAESDKKVKISEQQPFLSHVFCGRCFMSLGAGWSKHCQIMHRVTKSKNFPDSKIFVAKTFWIIRVKWINLLIRLKIVFANLKHKQ